MSNAKDLITLARAKNNISTIVDTTYDTLLAVLITAASQAIERYCNRDFYSKTYDEIYSGRRDNRLILRQAPIQEVKSVRYRPVVVLKVKNTNTSTIQQARVTVISTGLKLVHVASGAATITTTGLTFAGNATLTAMANAIIGIGSGWTAQVVGDSNDYGLWPSADLYVASSYGDGVAMSALTARGEFAELKMHTTELQGYSMDPRGWLLRSVPYSDPELMMGDNLEWPMGVNNIRVQYIAGFTTIPEDVQEACACLVAMIFWQCQRDTQISNSFSSGSGTAYAMMMSSGLPGQVRGTLDGYKIRRIQIT